MPITIQKQKILANTQTAVFSYLTIDRDGNGNLSAKVYFNLFNEFNQPIGSDSITYFGSDFNSFWDGFITGQFLYEQLAAKNGVQVADAEDDFVNYVPPPLEADNE